jgi:hypothetical protein
MFVFFQDTKLILKSYFDTILVCINNSVGLVDRDLLS